ncbi:hypothetical protein CRENBAI_026517 [Crenichthys baileyi]|uniref:Sushi domain-containing protein 5 n=1 Tax=Crenichthys baileyi TaxID=28760 RepID=A0AAV9RAF3_9TELE
MLYCSHQIVQSLLLGCLTFLVVTSVVNAEGRVFVLDPGSLLGFREAEQACASRHARLASAEELRQAVVDCFFSHCTRGWLYGGTVGTTVCNIEGSSLKAVNVKTENVTEDTAHLSAFCMKDKVVACGDPPSFPHARLQHHSGFEIGDELLYTCSPGYMMPSGHTTFSLLCDSCGEWYGTVQICVKDAAEPHVDYEDKFQDSYEEADHDHDSQEEVLGDTSLDGKRILQQQETRFWVNVEEDHQDHHEVHNIGQKVINNSRTFEGAVDEVAKREEDAFTVHPRFKQDMTKLVRGGAAAATEEPVSLLSQKHMFWFPSEAFREEVPPFTSDLVTQATLRASGAQSEESKENQSQERLESTNPIDDDDHDDHHHDHDDELDRSDDHDDELDRNNDHDDEQDIYEAPGDDRDDNDHEDSRHDDLDIHEDDHADDHDPDSHQEEDADDHVNQPAQYDDLDRTDRHKHDDDHDDHYDMGEHEDDRDRTHHGTQEYDDRDDAYDDHQSKEDHDDDHRDNDGEHPDNSEEHPESDDHDDGKEHYELDEDDIHDNHEDKHQDDHDSHEDDDDHPHVIISVATKQRPNITQGEAGSETSKDNSWLDGYPVDLVDTENGDSTKRKMKPSEVKTTNKPNDVEVRKRDPHISLSDEDISPTLAPKSDQGGEKKDWPGFRTPATSSDHSELSNSPSHSDTLDYDTQQVAPTHSWLDDLTDHPFLDHGPAPPGHDSDTFLGVMDEHAVDSLPGEMGEMEGEKRNTICVGEDCPPHPPSSSSQGAKVAAIIVAVCAVATAVIVGVWCYQRKQQKSSMYEMNGKGQGQSRQGQQIEMQQKV